MNRDFLIALTIGIGIGLASIFIQPGILIPLLIVCFVLILGRYFIFSQESGNSKTLMRIFTAGFILRLSLCILLAWVSYIKRKHIFFLNADDYSYIKRADAIFAFLKESGYLPGPKSLKWMDLSGDLSYPYWIAYLYYFFGQHYFIPLFINCSLGAFSIILIYLVVKQICDYKVAISSTLLFTFWPSLVLWSTQNLKESIVIFLILMIFLCITKLNQKVLNFGSLLSLLISFFLIYNIQSLIGVILILSSVISFIVILGRKKKFIYLLFLAIIFFTVLNGLPNFNKFLSYRFGFSFETIDSLFGILDKHHKAQIVYAETAYLPYIDIAKPLNFFVYSPSFLLYILFSPFPWQISKLSHLFSVGEMLIWYFLAFFAFKGLLLTLRYKFREAAIILIFMTIMLLLYFAEGNVGTLFRHRAFIWPCWHLMISIGLFYRIKDIAPSGNKGPEKNSDD